MLSTMLIVNTDKRKLIILGSNVQLKKLYSHLPVRIFSKLMHPSVVVKDLGV